MVERAEEEGVLGGEAGSVVKEKSRMSGSGTIRYNNLNALL